MIGDKDVGLVGIQIFVSPAFYAAECQVAGEPGPAMWGVISPETIAKKGSHDHYREGGKKGDQQKQRHENDPLIDKQGNILHCFHFLRMNNLQK
jgi:hypothetical protein